MRMTSVIAAMVLSFSTLTTSESSAENICEATISVDQTDATLGPFGTEYNFVVSVNVDTLNVRSRGFRRDAELPQERRVRVHGRLIDVADGERWCKGPLKARS